MSRIFVDHVITILLGVLQNSPREKLKVSLRCSSHVPTFQRTFHILHLDPIDSVFYSGDGHDNDDQEPTEEENIRLSLSIA